MVKDRNWILLTLFYFLSIGLSSAQQELDLEAAIKLGLERNFSIQIEKQRVEIARNSNTMGNAGFWPSVNVGVTESTSLTEINNPASFLSSGNIKGTSFNPTVGAAWTLFNGFNVRITKDEFWSSRD